MAKKYLTSSLLTQGRIQGVYDSGPVIDINYSGPSDTPAAQITADDASGTLLYLKRENGAGSTLELWFGATRMLYSAYGGLYLPSATIAKSINVAYAGYYNRGFWMTSTAGELLFYPGTYYDNKQIHFGNQNSLDYSEPDLGVPTLYLQNDGDPSTGDNNWMRLYVGPEATDGNARIDVSGLNSEGVDARLEIQAGTLRLFNPSDPSKWSDVAVIGTQGAGHLSLGSPGHSINLATSVTFNSSWGMYRTGSMRNNGSHGSAVVLFTMGGTAAAETALHLVGPDHATSSAYAEADLGVATLYLQNDGDPSTGDNSWLRFYVKSTTDSAPGQAVIEGGGGGSSVGEYLFPGSKITLQNPAVPDYPAYFSVDGVGHVSFGATAGKYLYLFGDHITLDGVLYTHSLCMGNSFSQQGGLYAAEPGGVRTNSLMVGTTTLSTVYGWHVVDNYNPPVAPPTDVKSALYTWGENGSTNWTRLFTDSNGAGHLGNSHNQIVITDGAYSPDSYSDATAPSEPRLRIWSAGDPASASHLDVYVASTGTAYLESSGAVRLFGSKVYTAPLYIYGGGWIALDSSSMTTYGGFQNQTAGNTHLALYLGTASYGWHIYSYYDITHQTGFDPGGTAPDQSPALYFWPVQPGTGDSADAINEYGRLFADTNGAFHLENSHNLFVLAPESAYDREAYSDATAPATPTLRIWDDGEPGMDGCYVDLYIDSSHNLHFDGVFGSINAAHTITTGHEVDCSYIKSAYGPSHSGTLYCPNNAGSPPDPSPSSAIEFTVDETSGQDKLYIKVKYSDGTVKSATIQLS